MSMYDNPAADSSVAILLDLALDIQDSHFDADLTEVLDRLEEASYAPRATRWALNDRIYNADAEDLQTMLAWNLAGLAEMWGRHHIPGRPNDDQKTCVTELIRILESYGHGIEAEDRNVFGEAA